MDKDILQNQAQCIINSVCGGLNGASLREPRLISPLVLAYIGDTVYDLYVRTKLVLTTDGTAHGMHVNAAREVCAAAQARAMHKLLPVLTEDEQYVYKRGRNSHMGTVPKHALMADYRAATGFEALVGYLYLSQLDERLNQLMRIALSDEPQAQQQ